MKEILTTIALIVVTNWTEIGELKTKDGKTFSVREGKLQTNTVARVEWSEEIAASDPIRPQDLYLFRGLIKTNEFILKSVQGPVVAEKRVEITNVYFTNIYVMTNYELKGTMKWPESRVRQTNRITW